MCGRYSSNTLPFQMSRLPQLSTQAALPQENPAVDFCADALHSQPLPLQLSRTTPIFVQTCSLGQVSALITPLTKRAVAPFPHWAIAASLVPLDDGLNVQKVVLLLA